MAIVFKQEMPSGDAFGAPGAPPNWASARKHGVGTAIGVASKVWFTVADGILTEIYYPAVDAANTKDLRFLVTDGRTFFDEEGRDTLSKVEYIDAKAPAYHITNTARSGAYRIIKKIITDPAANTVVMNTRFEFLKTNPGIKLYLLFALHIKNRGYGNSARCARIENRDYLIAWRDDVVSAVTSDAPFVRSSAGYCGSSDGWQDLMDNYAMDWQFERAGPGNVALMAEVPIAGEFTVAVSFGRNEAEAAAEAARTLGRSYKAIEREYIKGWRGYIDGLFPLGRHSGDNGRRFFASAMVLKTHEDKTHRGALIASLCAVGRGQGRRRIQRVPRRMAARPCQGRRCVHGDGGYGHRRRLAAVSAQDATSGRLMAAEPLARRTALPRARATRRGRAPHNPRVAAQKDGVGRGRVLPDDQGRGLVYRQERPGHRAGQVGGEYRVFALDPCRRDSRARMRRGMGA
ncbi:MAG: hypothetical protein HY894_05930 [Deltaproteobacteria bacterium]|nr:hypothetical protein [Deltaproteobacteria bacterium]